VTGAPSMRNMRLFVLPLPCCLAVCCLLFAQFTPLYVGMAPFYNSTDPPVGGGYVDPVSCIQTFTTFDPCWCHGCMYPDHDINITQHTSCLSTSTELGIGRCAL